MALGLERSWRKVFYKAFLAGHLGVGKLTEMTRLVAKVNGRFRIIRFRVTTDLDPGSFKPFDVLLLMMTLIVEETAKPVSEGGAGRVPSDSLLQEMDDWFAKEEATVTESRNPAWRHPPGSDRLPVVSGRKPLACSAISRARSSMLPTGAPRRSSTGCSVSSLLDLVNKLLNECNDRLREATAHEWMFIGEEFDRPGIPISLVKDFFLNYGNIFKEIQVHAIFTVPIGMAYSEIATQLPCPSDRIHVVPDTPVFDRDHNDCKEGRRRPSGDPRRQPFTGVVAPGLP